MAILEFDAFVRFLGVFSAVGRGNYKDLMQTEVLGDLGDLNGSLIGFL